MKKEQILAEILKEITPEKKDLDELNVLAKGFIKDLKKKGFIFCKDK